MKKIHINVPMAFLMLIGIGMTVFGAFAVIDAHYLGTTIGVVTQQGEGFFNQRRLLGLLMVVAGIGGVVYSAMGQDGLFRKHFSQR